MPETISWWPPAPGWWLLAGGILLVSIVFFIIRKIYLSRQLKRDISAELDSIKQHYKNTHNKVELAKALSILLRRASISYYPAKIIAGLTGDDWLAWLDRANNHKTDKKFQSDIGHLLLTAPYMAEKTQLDYDSQALIGLCESWLSVSHKKTTSKATGTFSS